MLFQQQPVSSSSEEEEEEEEVATDWRSSFLRRREGVHRVDRISRGEFGRKRRRNRQNSCAIRLFVAIILLCLLVYETVILYSPFNVNATLRTEGRRDTNSGKPVATTPTPNAVSGVAIADIRTTQNIPQRPSNTETDERRRVALRAQQIEQAADMRDRQSTNFRSRLPRTAASDSASITAVTPNQAAQTGSKQAKQLSSTSLETISKPGADENFWDWFQKTKTGKGTVGGIECPDSHKRLCKMFYKFIRKYKIRSVYDISCTNNLPWMPVVLRSISTEIWGFRYHCSETNVGLLDDCVKKLQDFNFVSFTSDPWWRFGFPRDIDLVFAWDVLAHTAYGRVWTFFVKVRKQEIDYVLVDNYPGILNDPSPDRFYLNLRKHPFRFPAAKEVVQNVTEPGESANRQLLLYDGLSLPNNLG